MSWLIAICITLSIAVSLALVPLVRRAAHALGVVDHPDRDRKLQVKSTALGGGVAVFIAFAITFVITVMINRQFFERSLGSIDSSWYVLFCAAGAMLLVGLFDDAFNLRGRQKLLFQCLIVVALVGSGTVIQTVNVLGYDLQLGVFAFPITVLWLLIAVNALNLIDGADGMATTASCVICAGLGVLSLRGDSTALTGLIAFSLAGTLIGFLAYNRPPASIYLGDAGSMMIGLFVGVLAIWSNVKQSTILSSAPVAILAIPLFDSSAAVLRRWLTGRSIYTTDRAHLHHRLQERYGPVRMLFVVAGLCLTTTTLSVISVYARLPWLAMLGVVIVLVLLIVTRSFGHAEARLLLGRASHFAQSFTTTPGRSTLNKQHRRIPLQGVGQWETIWEPLVEFAMTHELAKVKIDLNLAWLHEGYHANWQSVQLPEKALQLSVSVPLFTRRATDDHQIQIGRLDIIAAANDPSVYERISDLSDQLVDLGPEIDRIVQKLEAGVKGQQEVAIGVPSAATTKQDHDNRAESLTGALE